MLKHKLHLMAVVGLLLLGVSGQAFASESRERNIRLASVAFAPAPSTRYISGEIAWVDVKIGKLQLRGDDRRGTQSITEYRINQQATNVTDPSDQRFLTLDDLRSGQYIAVEYELANSQREWMARKITVESTPQPTFQEMVGTLQAIDVDAGTMVLSNQNDNLTHFIFEPQKIVVMRSPSRQPVRLELNPGDPLKVEFIVEDGRRWAQTATLYSELPQPSNKTTTTTTTTSTTTTQ